MYPPYQPKLIANGRYLAEIMTGEPQEKSSAFAEGRSYYLMDFQLKGPAGWIKFRWAFSDGSTVYGDILLAAGGKRNSMGGINAPPIMDGKRVMLTIVQVEKKDKSKGMKNDVIAAEAVNPTDAAGDEPPASNENEEDALGQAVNGKGPGDDDVPFL